MKAKEDVISDFNKIVNMSASELEIWLKSNDSNSAGWPTDDGSGESVGHDSGRKIVDILKSNPNKEAERYTDEDVKHMRKVVAYCKRHLAQETSANNEKTPDEVRKMKSYASLKNWGHDFLQAQGKEASDRGPKQSVTSTETNNKSHDGVKHKDEEHERLKSVQDDNFDVDPDVDHNNKGDYAGTKRKAAEKQPRPSKKRETHKGLDSSKSGESDLAKDDIVTWKWGGGHPQGKVLDIKKEKTSIVSKNDNKITRNGQPDDPAVVLDTGKSKAIKLAHELD